MTTAHRPTIGLIALLALTGAAHAQDAPVRGLDNFAAPAAQPTPIPTPVAPVIVLPTPAPTPVPAAPPAARVATPPPSTVQPAPRPTPRAVPPPRAVETPVPTPASTPAAAPSVIAPAPAPVASPGPVASTPAATPVTTSAAGRPLWPWLLGGAALALAALALVARRRRRTDPVEDVAPFVPPAPLPVPAAVPAEPVRTAGLTLALRPVRAGLNLLSATVECEVTIANPGDLPAEAIRLDIRLTSAHAGLDADLAARAAQPVQRPAVAPFALAPGETRTVRKIVALPRDAIHVITAADRPMFVPIVAATARFRAADTDLGAAEAFAVGVERVDSAKLSPLWLDGPPRMFDNVAARLHVARG